MLRCYRKLHAEDLGLTKLSRWAPELHRWPLASSKICVGQRGEKGEGGFVFISEEGEAESNCFVLFHFLFSI